VSITKKYSYDDRLWILSWISVNWPSFNESAEGDIHYCFYFSIVPNTTGDISLNLISDTPFSGRSNNLKIGVFDFTLSTTSPSSYSLDLITPNVTFNDNSMISRRFFSLI
jgi:hypothetical protein